MKRLSGATFVFFLQAVFAGWAQPADPVGGADWGPLVGPWIRYEQNPIITLEGEETYSIQNGPQSVVRWKGQWLMFLQTSQPMVTKLAVSADGLSWKRPHHDYLLEPEMDWEGSYNLAKSAQIVGDEIWLYYFGKKNRREIIGLARSTDLEHWTKHPEPIFRAEDARLEGERVFPASVVRDGGRWYLFYDLGWDYGTHFRDHMTICVATSQDGVHFTDSAKNPMLTTGELTADSWDDGMVSQECVVKVRDWFYMMYSGSTTREGRKYAGKNMQSFGLARARHPEGPWEKYPGNPVFRPSGNAEDFDGIFLQHPCLVQADGQWRLYYNGWTLDPNAKNDVTGGARYSIGMARLGTAAELEAARGEE